MASARKKMILSNVKIVLLISFFDSLANGIVLPVLTPHVLEIGGDHIQLGLMSSGTVACALLSKAFIVMFDQPYTSQKFNMFCSILMALMSHLVLSFTSSFSIILFCRWIYTFTNRTETFCKNLIKEMKPKKTHKSYLQLIEATSACGMVLGPILSGYIFEWAHYDFSYNGLLASFVIFINMILLHNITFDTPVIDAPEISEIVWDCSRRIDNLFDIDFKKHWDTFLLRIMYTGCLNIYYSKHSYLTRTNYNLGTIISGYTISYQNMLMFAVTFVVKSTKEFFRNLSENFFEHSLGICSITLMGLYFAPSYECYLILIIPMIMTKAVVDCTWNDYLGLKEDEKLQEAHDTISVIASIFAPLIFGVLCQLFGIYAFRVMALLPMAVALHMSHQVFISIQQREELAKEGNKKDE